MSNVVWKVSISIEGVPYIPNFNKPQMCNVLSMPASFNMKTWWIASVLNFKRFVVKDIFKFRTASQSLVLQGYFGKHRMFTTLRPRALQINTSLQGFFCLTNATLILVELTVSRSTIWSAMALYF